MQPVNRRVFIKNSGIAMLGLSTIPAFLQRAVAGTAMPNKKKLVVLFQRGAADGLNIVVPFAEPNYYRATFHTRRYIEQNWTAGFEIVDIHTAGNGNAQDFVVLRAK